MFLFMDCNSKLACDTGFLKQLQFVFHSLLLYSRPHIMFNLSVIELVWIKRVDISVKQRMFCFIACQFLIQQKQKIMTRREWSHFFFNLVPYCDLYEGISDLMTLFSSSDGHLSSFIPILILFSLFTAFNGVKLNK